MDYSIDKCAKDSRIFNKNHPDRNVKQLLNKYKTLYSVHNRKYEVICPIKMETVEVAVSGHKKMSTT